MVSTVVPDSAHKLFIGGLPNYLNDDQVKGGKNPKIPSKFPKIPKKPHPCNAGMGGKLQNPQKIPSKIKPGLGFLGVGRELWGLVFFLLFQGGIPEFQGGFPQFQGGSPNSRGGSQSPKILP